MRIASHSTNGQIRLNCGNDDTGTAPSKADLCYAHLKNDILVYFSCWDAHPLTIYPLFINISGYT